MKWNPSAHFEDGQIAAIQSGRWTISKAFVDGATIYTLWRGNDIVRCFACLEEAKECAETSAEVDK